MSSPGTGAAHQVTVGATHLYPGLRLAIPRAAIDGPELRAGLMLQFSDGAATSAELVPTQTAGRPYGWIATAPLQARGYRKSSGPSARRASLVISRS